MRKSRLSVALYGLTFCGCVLVASCSTKTAFQCDKWNSGDFFRNATPGHIEACLKSGSSALAVDDSGKTPLHWVALLNQPPATIAVLLDAGADASAIARGGQTPLHKAAMSSGDPAVIHMLVRAGASLYAWTDDIGPPLHVASWFNENVEAILSYGVDPMQRHGLYGPTALHLAAGYNDNPEVVATLLRAGADPRAAYFNGFTPLHFAAAASDHPEVIDLLLDAGADARARTHAGTTAWDSARNNLLIRGTETFERLRAATFN